MRWSVITLLVLPLMLSTSLLAQQSVIKDNVDNLSAREWLDRIATAGQDLNYCGTFIYQSGDNFETSRITHKADVSGESERLEVLDGSPREVIRSNGQVSCILPDRKMMIVDHASKHRSFPAGVTSGLSRMGEYYDARLGEISRVAERDTRMLVLQPRDHLRYTHILWADLQSGLLLKAKIINEQGRTIEQFTFSQVTIGGDIPEDALLSPAIRDARWHVIKAYGKELAPDQGEWQVEGILPGYYLESLTERPLGGDHDEVLHYLFGDGLAVISVFIAPTDAHSIDSMKGLEGGATSFYRRKMDHYMITAIGEVPKQALQQLVDGIRRKETVPH